MAEILSKFRFVGIPYTRVKPNVGVLRGKCNAEKEQKKVMLCHTQNRLRKVVRVYPMEDAEFVYVASIFHSFFFMLSVHISFLNKKWAHTQLLVSRQCLLIMFAFLHLCPANQFYNNQCKASLPNPLFTASPNPTTNHFLPCRPPERWPAAVEPPF